MQHRRLSGHHLHPLPLSILPWVQHFWHHRLHLQAMVHLFFRTAIYSLESLYRFRSLEGGLSGTGTENFVLGYLDELGGMVTTLSEILPVADYFTVGRLSTPDRGCRQPKSCTLNV
ncbi:hypothetical protein V6N12_014983 [Hibiscus sabdariffa]|uniref:Uncharacterized protein n=1 Tax=Hibiscus sabdariffa TaxID=183260 RepID=A0ABR2DLU1_9ROSI